MIPDFLLLRFPEPPDCKRYFGDLLDLRAECPDVVSRYAGQFTIPEVQEDIPDEAHPELRPDIDEDDIQGEEGQEGSA